jgi:hypothetical protein
MLGAAATRGFDRQVSARALYKARPVALTAEASFNGALSCALMAARRLRTRNSSRAPSPWFVPGSTPRLRDDVVEVERHVDDAAIHAVAAELLEYVFPHFVANERHRRFRVFEELHVEADPLDGDSRDRGEAAKPPDPCIDPVLKACGASAPGCLQDVLGELSPFQIPLVARAADYLVVAKRDFSSIAIRLPGTILSSALSPGITISIPSRSSTVPVMFVVRK